MYFLFVVLEQELAVSKTPSWKPQIVYYSSITNFIFQKFPGPIADCITLSIWIANCL